MILDVDKDKQLMSKNYYIGTLASHSALNILSGGQKEGFKTILFTKDDRKEFYETFDISDKVELVESYQDCLDRNEQNNELILIPHGSFVAYLSLEKLLLSKIPLFGTRELLYWESDRKLKSKLMIEAGFKVPKEFNKINEIGNTPVIVKFDGAEGGKGYFVAKNVIELLEKIEEKKLQHAKMHFQEFIVGNKVYVQFFNSIIRKKLEIFGVDIRYETDIDSKIRFDDEWGFQIIGNIPAVLRESMLLDYYKMGKNFVEAVERNLSTTMIGPFCLETIVDKDLNIYCFEFSGRIVAGTNIFIPSSPYSYIMHKEEMWMGKRIAREIREAIEQNRLQEVLT
jgi:5-formaminoimidazole-4-carboxamide-1-(beta)-D-ribofuranosyl 5'-monophosphate synthetase